MTPSRSLEKSRELRGLLSWLASRGTRRRRGPTVSAGTSRSLALGPTTIPPSDAFPAMQEDTGAVWTSGGRLWRTEDARRHG